MTTYRSTLAGELTRRVPRGARVIGTCAAFLALLTTVAVARGLDGNTVNHLTFSGAVSIPGAVLPAGTYTFEAVKADVVRVSSRDGQRVFYTGFTNQVPRPHKLGRDVPVAFGEAQAGTPPPITTWYPVDRPLGHEFIYR